MSGSAMANVGGDRPGGRWFRIITTMLLLASGLGMLVPGICLLALGGSAYYALAGLLLLAVAVLVARRSRAGLHLYGMLFLATLAWSLGEVGFDWWALMPRLVFLAVGGLWLLLPVLRRTLRPPAGRLSRLARPVFAVPVFAVLAVWVVGAAAVAIVQHPAAPETVAYHGEATAWPEAGARDGEWPHYGNSVRGTRYSALAEITPANVGQLEQAWVYRSGLTIPGGTRRGGLEATPLAVDGMLYGCTAFSSVFALDPVSGRQLWRHDPEIGDGDGGHSVCRGVSFYRAPEGAAECPTRLLLGTVANKLIALDARTGQPCQDFGDDGEVNLLDGMGDFPRHWSHPTSPPVIVSGTAVVGAYVVDNMSTMVPSGVIRGYDAVTGVLKWAFDPGHLQAGAPETGAAPAEEGYTASSPNSWAPASGDEELGLVYLPMGNSSPDFFGGYRNEATGKYSSAVVALDAESGAVRWVFQTVHHDLWDYDVAAQPVLTDFPLAGGRVPALIIATKTGQIFVLDRRDGRPLAAVEERPVPPSHVPGERASPTQPFSVGMPEFAGADLTEADMWGLTPFDQLYCRIRFRQARYEGMFTPPGLGLSIRYPGELGGIDWGSVAVDEGRRILIVNSNHMADLDELITRAQAERIGLVPRPTRGTRSAPGGAMAGTPFAVRWGPFMSGLEVPCQRPPYGFLTAIDLDTRGILWTRTIGSARNSGPFGIGLGLPLPLGAPNIGGALATRGGVLFIAATQDEMFRAFDVTSGKLLWQTRLPAGGHATPMTYRGSDGRQYVLIAAGGSALRDKPGDHFIAYRLGQ